MNKTQNFNNLLLGKNAVKEAISINPSIIKVVHLLHNDIDFIKILNNNRIKYLIHNKDNFFSKFKSNVNHQGYALEFKEINSFLKLVNLEYIKKSLLLFKSLPIILMLDEITDMQNFGAILRTAYAAGVIAVIYKKNNQAQINDYVVKTSMGFINQIPLCPVANLTNTINNLKDMGFWVYATSLSKEALDYNKLEYDKPTVVIMGSEKSGISKIVEKNSDFLIKIPMENNVESLNVSVATGIILFNIHNRREN